jgi:hypothetical protein
MEIPWTLQANLCTAIISDKASFRKGNSRNQLVINYCADIIQLIEKALVNMVWL